MKILNLYCGIGGNRKLWGNEHEITAVEFNEEIAGIYKEYFPEDKMVIGDAHEYLLEHYKEFDFIWSSPPCPTHSRARYWGSKGGTCEVKYPDWKLWQEILFLKHYASCKYVVENVIPFYKKDLFFPATVELERHLFWSNFNINKISLPTVERDHQYIGQKLYGFDLTGRRINHRKDAIIRNMVNPELGLYILEQAQGIVRQSKTEQIELF